MKKLLILFFILMLCLNVDAKSLNKQIKNIIKDSNISEDSISISVKNAANGKIIYEQNERILMHPASVQKILTLVPIYDVLGENYCFKTELFAKGNNEYIIKLGADPYLTSEDLSTVIKKIKPEKVKKIYIDDSIIEKKAWGEGWQWDDDLNSLMPKFNSYNLDRNLTKITVMPTEQQKLSFIINPQKSPMIFYNNVKTGDINNIHLTRDNIISANTLKLEGIVNTPQIYFIPNNNLRLYFEKKLTDELENKKIYLKAAYGYSKLSTTDIYIDKVSHPISQAIEDVLLNSNNMVIETLAKLAGGKYFNKQGTDIDGIKLFENYCDKIGIDHSRVRLVDASGVSKNNLVDADFITEFMIKNQNNKALSSMAAPGQGTMSTRLMPLKENLKAKTGTLSDISSIAGFLTAKSGQKYVFCIMINNPSSSDSTKKSLENYLIRELYIKL